MKLKKLVNESWLEEKKTLTKEEKKQFLGKVSRFNEYGKKMFRAQKLADVAKELAEMCKIAEVLTLSSVDETFDKITVERNMKELANLAKNFSKTSSEADILESRMKMHYDDMGRLLERYYEINDAVLDEVQNDQRVDHNMGTKPYDGWKNLDAMLHEKKSPKKVKESMAGAQYRYDNMMPPEDDDRCEICGKRYEGSFDDSNPVCDDCREECSACGEPGAVPTKDGKPSICDNCYREIEK